MKLLILAATALASAFAFAESATVLTLQRVNYKEYKRLYYDVVYDAKTCQINTKAPFDVYYKDNNTGERLDEFSNESADYFGPRINKNKLSPNSVALEFKAFDEIQSATGVDAEILVKVSGASGNCTAVAEIKYSDKNYTLEHIDIQVKKTLGFPSGVEWVKLKGRDSAGPVTDCVVGRCQ